MMNEETALAIAKWFTDRMRDNANFPTGNPVKALMDAPIVARLNAIEEEGEPPKGLAEKIDVFEIGLAYKLVKAERLPFHFGVDYQPDTFLHDLADIVDIDAYDSSLWPWKTVVEINMCSPDYRVFAWTGYDAKKVLLSEDWRTS